MKIYISGQISGLNIEFAKARFQHAAEKLKALGHQVINPFDLVVQSDELEWRDYMKVDLYELMADDCDAIYMLNGFETSTGARIERDVAYQMRKIILYEETAEEVIERLFDFYFLESTEPDVHCEAKKAS
jgi:Asp-tRNA(Asn)/Glu-tRNA(Gln) amidotransferase A subunit family amidase